MSADSQCQQCQQSGPGHGQGESPAADRQHEAPVPHGALASLQINSGVSFNKSSNIIVTKRDTGSCQDTSRKVMEGQGRSRNVMDGLFPSLDLTFQVNKSFGWGGGVGGWSVGL